MLLEEGDEGAGLELRLAHLRAMLLSMQQSVEGLDAGLARAEPEEEAPAVAAAAA